MRDHYVGDLSDLLKFNFLRAIARDDKHLGIAWYYVPRVDNKHDGKHLAWREEMRWHCLNPEIHNVLMNLPERSVSSLEANLRWPGGVSYHGTQIPRSASRQEWLEEKHEVLRKAQIIFLDPDNGLGEPTEKHATFDEIRQIRESGSVAAFITFPKRIRHIDQVRTLQQQLTVRTGATRIATLRICVNIKSSNGRSYVPTFRWFTLVDPDDVSLQRLQSFAETLRACDLVKVHIDNEGF